MSDAPVSPYATSRSVLGRGRRAAQVGTRGVLVGEAGQTLAVVGESG